MDPVATARPPHVAAADGEGVVVVVVVVVVVGGELPVVRPLFGRGVGDNGGQEVARLPAADARVVLLVAVADVVTGDVFFSVPLLSDPLELLSLSFVLLTRAGANRPGNSGGEGAHPRGVLFWELILELEVDPGLPPSLLRRIGGVGGHEEARTRATDARVVLAVAVLFAPLLSAPAELLGKNCVVFSRAGATRSSRSQRAPWGTGATGRRRCGPHCGVPRLLARQLS